MGPNTNSGEPTVYFPPTPIYKQRWVKIVFFIALSPLLLVAFLWLKEQPFFKSQPPATPQIATSSASIKEEDLPIALDILKNPMVYEWRGSVEGTLVTKDEKSISLMNDKSQTIRILVDLSPTGTKFFYLPKGPNKTKSVDNYVKLDDIPLGSKLTGEFWVFLDRKNEMKGGSFTIINQ